jgi:hypothetical protein
MRRRKLTRWLVRLAVVGVLVVTMAACGATAPPETDKTTATANVGIPAPGASPSPITTPTPTPTPTATAAGAPESAASPTPTDTPSPPGGGVPSPTPQPNPCAGLSGEIEVQVLVGPADAVGLEPVAVGTIPFAVTGSEAPYTVQGDGPISYEAVLEAEWGTYEVMMDVQTTVSGECVVDSDGGGLHLTVEISGEQMVEVTAEGFHGEYPWAGTQSVTVDLPLVDGAAAEGEGWVLVLHLDSP